jgi:hypothetical protein
VAIIVGVEVSHTLYLVLVPLLVNIKSSSFSWKLSSPILSFHSLLCFLLLHQCVSVCARAHTLFQPLPTWVTYFLFLPEPNKKFAKKLTHAIIRIHTRLIEAKVQIHHSLVLNKVIVLSKVNRIGKIFISSALSVYKL